MDERRSAPSSGCHDCALRGACALNRLGTEQPAFGQRIRERVFHRGDVLLKAGAVADTVRVVKLGIVFGYRAGLDGRSRPIGIVSRGGAFGIGAAFGQPSQASCVAVTTGRVCELPVSGLRGPRDGASSLLAEIGRSVTELLASITAWSEVMRLPGTVNQLAYVLLLLAGVGKPSIVQLPSQAALAELLGTRRETIARALRDLEHDGCICRREGKRCEVHPDRLLARLSRNPR